MCFRLLVVAAALAASAHGRAVDLGTIGPLYPIAEPHLLDDIRQRLQEKERSGELKRLEQQARARGVDAVAHPKPVAGVQPAETARTFYFDPSFTLDRNVFDDKGQLLFAAGTRKNPLEVVALSKHLLFFDARDQRQVARARELIAFYRGRAKPILVGGSYLDLMKAWGLRVYYDQQGLLTRRLGITQVPAIVSQEGLRLRIDELVLP
ncbi:type-F conjugative transfer system protein TraW [Herbaspirillum sp. HC18]|nr:type-F conjugative transfer system protein TraW [Herbaspirillum sp. HC18]